MPKFYVKWELDTAKIPDDPEQRVKGWLSMLEMTKANMKTGKMKDWGAAAGGGSGYGIMEESSEVDVFINLLNWMPYVKFEVIPVLTIDQTIESIKKVASARSG